MTTPSTMFLLSPCFNNYEIVATKVFQLKAREAVDIKGKKPTVLTLYEDTPYALYASSINPNESIWYVNIDSITKAQATIEVQKIEMILAFTCVALARVYESTYTIFIDNGISPDPSMAALYSFANTVNKASATWNDDMRVPYGVGRSPIMNAMNPYFFKNLTSNSFTDERNRAYAKNMSNDPNQSPRQGEDVTCPQKGNIFTSLMSDAAKSVAGNTITPSGYVLDLIKVGNTIITEVTNNYGKFNRKPFNFLGAFDPQVPNVTSIISGVLNSPNTNFPKPIQDYLTALKTSSGGDNLFRGVGPNTSMLLSMVI